MSTILLAFLSIGILRYRLEEEIQSALRLLFRHQAPADSDEGAETHALPLRRRRPHPTPVDDGHQGGKGTHRRDTVVPRGPARDLQGQREVVRGPSGDIAGL